MDRRLAAILAADVVGYSALMERDEEWRVITSCQTGLWLS
jgi:class 3 adenylate cyclase